MKQRLNVLWCLVVLGLLGCSSKAEKFYQLGTKAADSKDYFRAVTLFEKSFEEYANDRSACQKHCYPLAGEIAHLYIYRVKNPELGLSWLKKQRQLVIRDDDFVQVQKEIIRILIDYLNDYRSAVNEAYRLLNFNLNLPDYCEVVFSLSWSLFELRDKQGALRELGQCLGNIPIPETLAFNLFKLEVDILMSEKQYPLVIDKLKILIQKYSHLDKESGLRLQLALAYEESGMFPQAHQILDQILALDQSDERYIKLRKERLIFREKNQAGAKLRKRNR